MFCVVLMARDGDDHEHATPSCAETDKCHMGVSRQLITDDRPAEAVVFHPLVAVPALVRLLFVDVQTHDVREGGEAVVLMGRADALQDGAG